MPPKRKVSKNDIIDMAYKIIEKDGIETLNARGIAQKLNCSIQPIFHNFKNMEELKYKVINKIYETYKTMLLSDTTSKYAYKNMGLSYIKFAKEHPNFFKLLFMQESRLKPEEFMEADATSNEIIKSGQALTGLTYEEQKKLHLKVWIFTHGLACLCATNTCNFTDEEISELLETSVIQMIKGYIGGKDSEKNN